MERLRMLPRTQRRRRAALLLTVGLILALAPARGGQDFSGANASDDPCYKIKQMKKAILTSAEYQKAAGQRDPAYIQCHPLTITVTWKLKDMVNHRAGTDHVEFELIEDYPAFLMLHYGWFDGLQKKNLEKLEILGPEPCWEPCPGRAKAELILSGQAVCCTDSRCRRTQAVNLDSFNYDTNPADANGQNVLLQWRWDRGASEGRLWSSEIHPKPRAIPEGFSAFDGHLWEHGQYQVSLGQEGSNFAQTHALASPVELTWAEVQEGMKRGEMTKVFSISAHDPPAFPQASAYSLNGSVTVRVTFSPVEEERWRVVVKAWERDDTEPTPEYKDKDGVKKSLPLWMEFESSLTGEFVIRKVKDERSYKTGVVKQAQCAPKLMFVDAELLNCAFVECGPGYDIPSIANNLIAGELSGNTVQLTWGSSIYRTRGCVTCKPLKSWMGKAYYRQEFGSAEFIPLLNKEILPLKNGYTKTEKVQDWLKYTLMLTKIK